MYPVIFVKLAVVAAITTMVLTALALKERQHPELVPVIAFLMQNIPGNVLHLGHSPFITSMLDKINGYKHDIVHVDTNKDQIKAIKHLSRTTRYKHLSSWKSMPVNRFYSITVITAPFRHRMHLVTKLANKSYAIVIPHNGNRYINRIVYGNRFYNAIDSFKYKISIERFGGHVMVLSNYMDVALTLSNQ